MKIATLFSKSLIIIIIAATLPTLARAADGDTTTVTTFHRELVNWVTPHVVRFQFPAAGIHFTQVHLHITIGCPSAPGDCDPWDRTGSLSILVPRDTTSARFEIARFITPYDITGSGGPGTCPWDFDVTDYQSMLHDSVSLSLQIETWINTPKGWLITATFEFIEGQLPLEPYRVVNVWDNTHVVYGDPDRPLDSTLAAVTVDVDDVVDSMLIRVTTTGHGQGNSDNAAEFASKIHSVYTDGNQVSHTLWRNDCGINPCSPQLGTWEYDRAGWCPGAAVDPWIVPVTQFDPGFPMEIQYGIQAYNNACRPNNPDCVSGHTCTDCDYNSTGHTEPNYNTVGQAVFFRTPVSVSGRTGSLPQGFVLDQNFPNPFNPTTAIRFETPHMGHVRLAVYNVTGQEVARLVDGIVASGSHSVAFDGSRLGSGIYFYTLQSAAGTLTRKMLLMK
jgi:hypothetical protein